ncbi:MAG: glycosyltransferase, partial [Chryseobacterium sp.]|nr:glycosyltransferase [Candidatus Chryseobacterium enterohippi]
MSPLVTIVVVSYNHSRFIKENLDSILSQTYPNIQLIVADDASPDNSVEVFEEWLSDNNYPALKNYHKKNTGLATTLNECIKLAKGKYIKLIAADDYLHPDAIEECVAKMEESGDQYGMVHTDTYCIDNSSTIIKDFANYNELGNIDPLEFGKKLIEGNRIAALTVMMRLDVVIETGDYDAYYLAEDYYRWLMINNKYLIAYIPKKLAYYRLHENNISKLKAEKIEQENLILKMLFDNEG